MKRFFVYVETYDKPKMDWVDDFDGVMVIKRAEEAKGHSVYVYQLCGVPAPSTGGKPPRDQR